MYDDQEARRGMPSQPSYMPQPSSHSGPYPGGLPQNYMGHYGGRPSFGSVEPMGDYVDANKKKRRGNLPKAVTDVLRVWFTEHVAHPYPTEDEKQQLMNQTGLTLSQVSFLFETLN